MTRIHRLWGELPVIFRPQGAADTLASGLPIHVQNYFCLFSVI